MPGNAKRIDAIDNLLLAIFPASFVVPTIGQSFGLDIRLIWVPTICYSVWIVFTGYVKPRISYSDSQERSMVERIRGWSYVTSLPITLILNSIIIPLSPHAPYVLLVCFAVIVSVGVLLAAADVALIKTFFEKEIKCMDEAQKLTMIEMVKETGVGSIWASWCVITLNFNLIVPKDLTLPTGIATLFVASLMFVYSYYRNRKSIKIAGEISHSLIGSKWSKRYNATAGKKRRKT